MIIAEMHQAYRLFYGLSHASACRIVGIRAASLNADETGHALTGRKCREFVTRIEMNTYSRLPVSWLDVSRYRIRA